jgi:oligopeptide transport system substrate-binding protein
MNFSLGSFSTNIVSNGPFMILIREFGKRIIVEKNPYYWDYEMVKLDEIEFMVEYSGVKRIYMFKNKKIDVCVCSADYSGNPPDIIDERDLREEVCFGCRYFIFNTLNKPLDDKNVRMALSTAIQRKTLLNLLSKNPNLAAYKLIPILGSAIGNESSKMFDEDLLRARELLAIAGYRDGKNFPKLRVVCTDDESQRTICSFLKSEWKKALNVDIEIDFADREKFLSVRKEGSFDICFGEWFGDYPDSMTFLSVFSKKSQQNYGRWQHDGYNDLISSALYFHNDDERSKLLKNAEQVLIDDMPVMPLYFTSGIYLVGDRVQNWDSNLLDVHLWKFIGVRDN